MDESIAKVLRKIREGKGLSQEELAWKAGLHRIYISQIERSLKNITVKTLFRICLVLETPIDKFLKEVTYEINKLSS